MSLIISLDHRENLVFIAAQNNGLYCAFLQLYFSQLPLQLLYCQISLSLTWVQLIQDIFIFFEVFVEGVVPVISLSVSLSFVYRTTDFVSSIFSSRIC